MQKFMQDDRLVGRKTFDAQVDAGLAAVMAGPGFCGGWVGPDPDRAHEGENIGFKIDMLDNVELPLDGRDHLPVGLRALGVGEIDLPSMIVENQRIG
ncbi:hypothetical protein LZK80_15220 [Rhizobium leguminosarum]|nr:hypothetical protein LZK80_15220 [Rhizobium leguminosarum]